MLKKKRTAAAVSLLSEIVRLRRREARAVELLERLTGKSIVDSALSSEIDACYPNETKLSTEQASALLAKIERGEFSLGRARRMKGNGERRAS